MNITRSLLVLSLSASSFACSSSGSGASDAGAGEGGGTCATAGTGSIAIAVTGLPAGVNGAVTITGPAGAQTATATSTLPAAPSGDYTIAAANVGAADPIVRSAYKATVSTSSAKLCDGQTVTVNVSYALIATSNKLWWGSTNSDNDTLGYSSSALAATGSPVATIAASTAGALPGAFDRDGNLWVIDGATGSVGLKRYNADSLATGGAKTPDVVLSSDAFIGGTPGPVSLAIDPSGNLWVGVLYSQSIVEIDGAQSGATGTVTPKVVISNVDSANALAFDVKGNLWVGSGDKVLEYQVQHLAASTSAAPDVSITSMSPQPVVAPLTSVLGIAFTPGNELWVNYDGTLAKLTSLQIGSSGTLTPEIQIKADVLSLPGGIAFDEGGGLWMAYTQGKFCKFGATQLAASGSVAPEVVVTSASIGSATSPAFFPSPAGSPLYSSLK